MAAGQPQHLGGIEARTTSGPPGRQPDLAAGPPEDGGQVLGGSGVQVVTEIVGEDDGAGDVGGRHRLGDREHALRRGAVRRQRQRPGLIQGQGGLQSAQQGVDRAVVGDEPDPSRGIWRRHAEHAGGALVQDAIQYLLDGLHARDLAGRGRDVVAEFRDGRPDGVRVLLGDHAAEHSARP